MKLLVADGQRLAKEAAARGEKVAVWGPSPGFRELRWIKPVLAGDTISFSSVVETKRTSEKRPEWGILQARNTGINQRGELVYSFLATAFVPRRNVGEVAAPHLVMAATSPGMTKMVTVMVSRLLPRFIAIDDSREPFFC